MLELTQLARYWRIGGTGLSFIAFGLGGLVLRLFVFPLLQILVRNEKRRVMLARRIIKTAFRFFVELMRCLGVLRYEITGLERLKRRGLLILANHPTLIDTVFLMAFVDQADCIVKNALWRNPFTHGPVRAAGYISNDDGPQLVTDCIDSLQEGSNLIIFPEGTRTPENGAIVLKRGAANIAIRSGSPVTPVVIRCQPLTLCKGRKWWNVPATAACFYIDIRQDIDTETVLAGNKNPAMASRYLTDYLQDYFMKESQPHAAA